MSYYESVFIARQDVTATQVDALTKSFSKIIEDHGGKVARVENWGLRGLAYKIKKNRKGHYILINIDSPSEAVHEMERQMRLNEDVLRHMTIRVDELSEESSALAQAGNERSGNFPRNGERPRPAVRNDVDTKSAKPVNTEKPDPEAVSESKPEAVSESKPEAVSESKPEAVSESKGKADVDVKGDGDE